MAYGNDNVWGVYSDIVRYYDVDVRQQKNAICTISFTHFPSHNVQLFCLCELEHQQNI